MKGILAFWKAPLFAGCRRNEGLGRSAARSWVSPRDRRRADDSGCPKDAEEGNAVSMRHKAHALDNPHVLRLLRGRVLHSVLRPVHVNPHYTPWCKPRWWGDGSASRLGKPAQAGGTNTGVGTDGRSAARRVSPLRSQMQSRVSRREKEGDQGLRPCEDLESSGQVARTS